MLFVASQEFRDNYNLGAKAQVSIDEANWSFEQDAINVRLYFAHQQVLNYHEDGTDMKVDLDNLYHGSNGLYTAHTLRETHLADVCVLFVSSGDVCGYAQHIPATKSKGYAVVQGSCVQGNRSTVHEISHLIGCRHAIKQDPDTKPYILGHGYIKNPGPDAEWRTIMAITDDGKYCKRCPRIPFFSNPGKNYHGSPRGNVENAYVSSVINSHAYKIANFYPEPSVYDVEIDGPAGIMQHGYVILRAYPLFGRPPYNYSYTWKHRYMGIFNPFQEPIQVADAPVPLAPWDWNIVGHADSLKFYVSVNSEFMVEVEEGDRYGEGYHSVLINDDYNKADFDRVESYNEGRIPNTYILEQNYPNPFNPNTTIRFGIPKSTWVTVSILTISGQFVTNIVNQELSAGYHEVFWNGKNQDGSRVSSGMYLYVLKTEYGTNVRKMSLIK